MPQRSNVQIAHTAQKLLIALALACFGFLGTKTWLSSSQVEVDLQGATSSHEVGSCT